MNRMFSLALLALLVLPGCASRQDAIPTTSSQSSPVSIFNIKVEPVTDPQQYQYGPAIGQFIMKSKTEMNGETTNVSLRMKYSVIQEDDTLLWHLFVPEWTQKGKKIAPSVPLLDMTINTDLRGVPANKVISFPIIKAYNITDPATLQQLDIVAQDISESLQPLPGKPIATGATVFRASLVGLKRMLDDVSGQPLHTLEGEFTYKGVRYVSTVLNSTISAKIKGTDQHIILSLTGRNIFRKDNMENAYGVSTVVARDTSGNLLFRNHSVYARVEESPLL